MKCLGERAQDLLALLSSLSATMVGPLLVRRQRQNMMQVVVVGNGDQGAITIEVEVKSVDALSHPHLHLLVNLPAWDSDSHDACQPRLCCLSHHHTGHCLLRS